MKPAFQKDAEFLSDVRKGLNSGGFHLWWLGQSGFLATSNGRALVMDPYLSDSLTRKYSSTDKPHVRITERVVDPAALGALGVIEVVTSSHNHTDHFDPETLIPLLADNRGSFLVVPESNRQQAVERLSHAPGLPAAGDFEARLVGLDAGVCASVAGAKITGIAAAHNTVERDAAGHCLFLGYVIHWGGLTIYHSGDTLWHDGLVSALRPFNVDLALLPINGSRIERRVAGNLDGREAARLAHDIGAQWVIPCHYDLFGFNSEPPDLFAAECRRVGQRFYVLRNGEGWVPAME